MLNCFVCFCPILLICLLSTPFCSSELHLWKSSSSVHFHPALYPALVCFRVQKQRATRSEDAVGQLNAQLLERDALCADLRAQTDDMRSLLDKITKEKAQIISENSALKTLAFYLLSFALWRLVSLSWV